jgi:mono/diheme cytochrome c family protein
MIRSTRLQVRAILACLAIVLSSAVAATAKEEVGEAIYRKHCAKCHGNGGEGVADEYAKPLIGDHSVQELARIVEKTMPEDDPGTCVGEDARLVARYMYDAFYSPVAQARHQPARIELSRLTVRQYRQSVADLVGGFRWNGQWGDKRGLQAEYFKTRTFRRGDRVIERLDPTVEFNFGTKSPDADKIPPDEFSIRWTGGLLAPESGEYEIVVSSENGARLWLNDPVRPLVDASVKSGTETEHRASIQLLGGRIYPLRLEYFKNKQGKDRPGSIALKWKLPHRAVETIPARNLSPKPFPVVFVVTTPFPPDDRSVGYERGTSVSQAWEQASTDAALETADYVMANLADLSGARPEAPDRLVKLKDFCSRWVERAFRRPLGDEQKRFFIDRQFELAREPEMAVYRVVLLSLVSPRFLYQDIDLAGSDPYDVATRISLAMWDSIPDQTLRQAAASGGLTSSGAIRWKIERMLDDPRTRVKLHQFFVQWLKVDGFSDLAKDSKRFPEFDEEIVSDLHTGLDLFLDDVLWSESSNYQDLLLADWLYLNGRLAKFYGAKLPADAPFQKVVLNPGERAGVLTNPYLMAGFAYTSSSSPIHRGVFVARSILGRALRPPPEAVAPLAPELKPELTTRQRVTLQTKSESCQSCHRMINPLGFAFETFDAVGRFRSTEKGRPIDAAGEYQTRDGEFAHFTDVRGLAEYLADSDETHAAFVEQLFHYVVKQPIRAFGPNLSDELQATFVKQNYNIRKLLVEIVVRSALRPSKDVAVSRVSAAP